MKIFYLANAFFLLGFAFYSLFCGYTEEACAFFFLFCVNALFYQKDREIKNLRAHNARLKTAYESMKGEFNAKT